METPLPSITDYGLSYCPRCGNGVLLPLVDRFTDPNTKQHRVQITLVCVGDPDGCTHTIANPSPIEDYLAGDALEKVERMLGRISSRGDERDG